ncbi:MAG: FHA domain-containing protein [Anaerolineales bacterium]|nr:FHA domain-containing protein [Anaerolineales bacterium]
MQAGKRLVLWLLVCGLFLSPVAVVQAQSGLAIRISQIVTVETPEAMTLKVYYNIYDPKTGLPVVETLAETARIDLPGVNFFADTRVQKPDVPIYIVFLLDASGTMIRAVPDVRRAAKAALNNTPDNAFFSVVQFNSEIRLLQDFTQNISAVNFAIDQYQAASKETCLYDALFTAAESLQKAPPGRRAIILFADGRDETFVPNQPCSKKTFMEVTEFAQKTQIPINTIGLASKESNLNEVELKGMAASTGGFSTIAQREDISQAFQAIMDGLKAQWMVQAEVYPKQGSNPVVLTLNLNDKETLSVSFSINSETDYEGPPSPVKGQFAGLQFVPENLTYDIQLSMTSPEQVEYVKIEVWDVKGGLKVAEFTFDSLRQNNVFNISTSQMTPGRDYQLRISAISKEDKRPFAWFTNAEGKRFTVITHEFLFDPSAVLPSVTVQAVSIKNNDLVLSIKTTNPALIGGFDGWLVDEATNTKVEGSDFTAPAESASTGQIIVPLSQSKVPDGKYTLFVRVLGKDGQVYNTAQFAGVVYQAVRPNLVQVLVAALVAAPVILFMIVAILLGVVGFMMYSSRREKTLTGTPVLQGRLGGKLADGVPSGASLPIADEEPLSARKPATSSSAPASQASRPPLVSPAPSASASADATLIAPPASQATLLAVPVSRPPASLTIVKSPPELALDARLPLQPLPFVIGRVEGNLVLKEPNISRRHAEISFDAVRQVYLITDFGSSNGTFVDGQRIRPGQPVSLRQGAVIHFGPNVSVRFEVS